MEQEVNIKVLVSGLDVHVKIDDDDSKDYWYPDYLINEDDEDGVIEAIKDALFNEGSESHFNG